MLGTVSFLPERVLDNRGLAERFGCSEDWILSRTGIRERRFVEPGTSASDIGLRAAERALAAAGIAPRDLELVICATYTPDMAFPSTACLIQDRLGAKPAAAFAPSPHRIRRGADLGLRRPPVVLTLRPPPSRSR